ncbi:arginyl-tRNA synthetase [Pullulanibacillus pueri]|uniref:Arginine--tRNA ligase n=1 Tax=Pullulanibacillus pueri TaxID=1437324 RepID=A0A8J3EMI0_9BACL|nr:arginine--tRNA ligase [Pullulanibacillus pueri]MBM7682338.1 arginyl-tRNA synthetase [Pullulanibacillus pueri]GGH80742.1 arginine--tRNA ligase 1 [Pullulanibacillus pueri]
MEYYIQQWAQLLSKTLGEALSPEEIMTKIEIPKFTQHGDLAFPCFVLAKLLKQSPQSIAEQLAVSLNHKAFKKFEAKGPYINAFINRKEATKETINRILYEQEKYGSHTFGKGKTITFDLSSPNIAKPFSMGHLRSTVIGSAISHIAEKCGYQVIRINYIGDWGTQFGKLIAAYKRWGDEAAVKRDPIGELFKLYTRFHEEATLDPQLDQEGRFWFKELELGNPEAHALWEWFREESLAAFNRIYTLLNVTFDSMNGESFYNDKMEAVVTELQNKGLLEASEGAMVVRLEDQDLPPALIKKQDGATLYATRDLASALYRKQHYHFDLSLYVVGHEQTLHFNQVKSVLSKMGYSWADDMEHIPFGMILKDGKKMSTRKGKVVLLEQVLKEIIERADHSIKEKNPELEARRIIAEQVGVGAVIYHDLKHYRRNDVEFSLEEMLKFEGNTGPYLQYTHARGCSILRKAKVKPSVIEDGLEDDPSWELVKLLAWFPHTIEVAFEERDPSTVAKSLFKIAQAFNHYYAHTRILGGAESKAKLGLTRATILVIKEGLRLLGIQAPVEM